jgi:hypothetical protein
MTVFRPVASRGAVILALALTAFGARPAAAQEKAVPAADPADVASIDAILTALYDVISGPPGQARDWDRFRSLFAPGARLIPVGVPRDGSAARATVLTVDGYIERTAPLFEANGFHEIEVARTTEQFGHIAHVFSTYESRRDPRDAEPFARGINSIQLMHDGTRWWIVTIFWDSERPDQPIPARYLPRH